MHTDTRRRRETENGIPQFCCCCETHKRAHSPNPQARGPLSQCDGVFSICDENGRVSIATRMEYGRAFTGSGTLVSDDPAVLNLYFPCLFTRFLLPHVHQVGTVHCPFAPRAPGAWRCWRTWSDMAALYSAWLRARASSRPKQSKNRPQDARPPWPPQPPPRGQRPRQRPPPLTRPPASPSNSSAAASVPSAAVTSAVEMWWREGAQGCEVGMFQSQGFHRRLRVSREWSGPPMASACGAADTGRRCRTWEGLTSRRP